MAPWLSGPAFQRVCPFVCDVTVGAEATVGAHALVRHDVPAHVTVVSPEPTPLE